MSWLTRAVMGVVLGLAVAACGRSEPKVATTVDAAKVPKTAAGPKIEPAPAPPEEPAPEPNATLKATNAKAFAHTAGDALGTLPEGVGIAVGQVAPDVTLKDSAGGEVTLSSLLGKRPRLLVFYRGGW